MPDRSLYISPAEMLPETILFGRSKAMLDLKNSVDKIAGMDIPVLIQGESGTGKELISRYIHSKSPWASGPFIKVNCPAIPAELLESELFGHEKGAFTGAYDTKPGLVEMAQGGTLFLDEIGELDPALQPKVLHFLQDGSVSRIGGIGGQRISVRVICATNRMLDKEVSEGAFRADLLYRINVVTLHLAALRERVCDIPTLVAYFVDEFNRHYNCSAPPLSPATLELLKHHHWPGNIREMENLVKRYVILNTEEAITAELLRFDRTRIQKAIDSEGAISLKELTKQAMQEVERQIILGVLHATNWNRKEAARVLKISYRALFYKVKQTNINPRAAAATSPAGAGFRREARS